MKKLVTMAAAAAMLVLPGAALAFSSTVDSAVGVPAGQTQKGTLFLAGVQVNIAGTVDGDVVCTGSDVAITGTVHGDVICAGQTVTVTGTVDGSVRVAGASVNLGGAVARNVMAAGQVVTTQSDLAVGGDAGVFAQTANLAGSLASDLYGAMDHLQLNAKTGTVSAVVGRLSLGDNAKITGNLWYTAPEASTFDHSRVQGNVSFTRIQHDQQSAAAAALSSRLYWIAAALVVTVFLMLLAPRPLRSLTVTMQHQIGLSIGFGALVLFGAPFLIAIVAATAIGIPAAVLLLVAYLAWLTLSPLLAGITVAAWVMERTGTKASLWWPALAGAAGAMILAGVPVVGSIFMLMAAMWAVGALVTTRFKPRDQAKNSATA